jgi:hypothetical protein
LSSKKRAPLPIRLKSPMSSRAASAKTCNSLTTSGFAAATGAQKNQSRREMRLRSFGQSSRRYLAQQAFVQPGGHFLAEAEASSSPQPPQQPEWRQPVIRPSVRKAAQAAIASFFTGFPFQLQGEVLQSSTAGRVKCAFAGQPVRCHCHQDSVKGDRLQLRDAIGGEPGVRLA